MAPNAIAIGNPVIPVLGMPTAKAFLYTFLERYTSISSGSDPNNSFARATHNATAIGSVHPMAGTTSQRSRLSNS